MLGALTLACLRVVLLPGEASFLPAFVDGVDDVLTEVDVEFRCALLVRAFLLGDVLLNALVEEQK